MPHFTPITHKLFPVLSLLLLVGGNAFWGAVFNAVIDANLNHRQAETPADAIWNAVGQAAQNAIQDAVDPGRSESEKRLERNNPLAYVAAQVVEDVTGVETTSDAAALHNAALLGEMAGEMVDR